MENAVNQLRELAGSLLREGTVDVLVGYETSSIPLRTSPCFIRDAADVARLTWGISCENNLATYLRDQQRRTGQGKVGVVAKGCDGRAIVAAIAERQLDRDRLYIIAVPCEGVIDRHRVEQQLDGQEVLEARVEDGELVVVVRGAGADDTVKLPVADTIHAACQTCSHRTAPVYDALVGEPPPPVEVVDDYAEVRAVEALSAAEKWEHFAREYSECIRCYACREACPLCYCNECFVDQTQPAWFGKTDDPSDTLVFHAMRALHMAGRCVDCGACGRACPMHIDVRALNRKLIKDVAEWYAFTAGVDPDAPPPLSTFASDDPQEFIK
jgi:ferredoxin